DDDSTEEVVVRGDACDANVAEAALAPAAVDVDAVLREARGVDPVDLDERQLAIAAHVVQDGDSRALRICDRARPDDVELRDADAGGVVNLDARELGRCDRGAAVPVRADRNRLLGTPVVVLAERQRPAERRAALELDLRARREAV